MRMDESTLRNTLLDVIESSLEAQLRAVRRLRAEPSIPHSRPLSAQSGDKGMSQVNMACDILASGQPMHVNDLIAAIAKRFGVQVGIRTISRVIAACGLDQQDWSADYRVFSRSPWQQRQLFKPLIEEGCDYFSGLDHINLAGDFTHLAKTGRSIPLRRAFGTENTKASPRPNTIDRTPGMASLPKKKPTASAVGFLNLTIIERLRVPSQFPSRRQPRIRG